MPGDKLVVWNIPHDEHGAFVVITGPNSLSVAIFAWNSGLSRRSGASTTNPASRGNTDDGACQYSACSTVTRIRIRDGSLGPWGNHSFVAWVPELLGLLLVGDQLGRTRDRDVAVVLGFRIAETHATVTPQLFDLRGLPFGEEPQLTVELGLLGLSWDGFETSRPQSWS